MSDEERFEVIDKRRVSAEAPSDATEPGGDDPRADPTDRADPSDASSRSQEPGASGAPQSGSGDDGPIGPPIGARDVAVFCVTQLHDIAWSRLGLVPNPTSGTIERDLNDARLAIDCVGDLVARLEPGAEPTLKRELQTMLSNLRLNFVQQSQRDA